MFVEDLGQPQLGAWPQPGSGSGLLLTPAGESVHDPCMAVKTITIDLEAYALLSRQKREGQSFSQVIKEHFAGHKTGRDLRAVLAEVHLSEATLDAVDAQVKSREAQVAKAPQL